MFSPFLHSDAVLSRYVRFDHQVPRITDAENTTNNYAE